METRNVTLTLAKAKEWYNSSSVYLKEVALQAFTKEELEVPAFEKIKTLEDAMDALGMSSWEREAIAESIRTVSPTSKASAAMIKLNIIRKALNFGKNMEFLKGDIYYPCCPFLTKKSTWYDDEIKNGEMKIVATFKYDGDTYRLVGGYGTIGSDAGLGYFDSPNGVGLADTYFGFLGCATGEIAQHFSKYFAKEIFDAKYGDLVKYTWD